MIPEDRGFGQQTECWKWAKGSLNLDEVFTSYSTVAIYVNF